MEQSVKHMLIKSSQANGHYCAARHFSFEGDVVTADALTAVQWAEVGCDPWLSVLDAVEADGIESEAEVGVPVVEVLTPEVAEAVVVEPVVEAVTVAVPSKGKAKS